MKLKEAEKSAILNGARTLRRPVRKKRGRELKTGIKRGQVHALDDSKCLHIQRVTREGDEWVIRFDLLGSWAMPNKKDARLSVGALEELLPPVLSWTEEPDVQVGDVYVFDWHKIRDANEGQSISAEEPKTYIQITSVGRGKKGEHIARYRKCGFEEDKFLAHGHGHTKNPRRALVDPDRRPELLAAVDVDPDQQERDEVIREVKRREAGPTKRQKLVIEREAHKRRLRRTKNTISRRLLPGLIERLDAEIDSLDEREGRRAA